MFCIRPILEDVKQKSYVFMAVFLVSITGYSSKDLEEGITCKLRNTNLLM